MNLVRLFAIVCFFGSLVTVKTEIINLDALIEDLQRELNPISYYQKKIAKGIKLALLKNAPNIYMAYLKQNDLHYSPEELKKRFIIFKDALQNVIFENKGVPWTKGINKFSDKSNGERMNYLGYNRSRIVSEGGTSSPADIVNVEKMVGGPPDLGWPLYPSSDRVDWRERGAMTESQDQGKCGVCWAFAATSIVESLYFIKTGVLRSMSIQQVVDCTYSTSGCSGGWYGDAYSYLRHSDKLLLSSSYPLNLSVRNGNGVTVNRGCSHRKVRLSEDAMKVAYLGLSESSSSEAGIIHALSRQPLSAGMFAPDSLFSYKSGVFIEERCPNNIESNNHAVVLAGYSTTTFLIKNSWGSSWGEGGYFKLKRGHSCGIMTDVLWPTLYTYPEQDPDSSYSPCVDKQPWCRAYAGLACSTSLPFRQVCPYSCSVCSCRDVMSDCSSKIDLCETDTSLRLQCRRSCKLCYCPPGTSLCRTRCLPYWHTNFKPRYCNQPGLESNAFEYEE